MRHLIALACTAAFWMTCVSQAPAVVFSDAPERHVVLPGSLISRVNLDGVAMVGARVGNQATMASVCTGALISDRHVLTAAHCLDEGIEFFDTAVGFELVDQTLVIPFDVQEIRFADSWPQLFADIAVLELADAVPPEVPRYPLYAGEDEVGAEMLMVGYGVYGLGEFGVEPTTVQPTQKHAGLNEDDEIRNDEGIDFLAYDFDNGQPEQNTIALLGFESDLGLGADEAFTSSGDSGGPLFLNGAIAGVISHGSRYSRSDVTDELDYSWGEVAFDTRVSSFRRFLAEATDHTARFVGLTGDFNESGEFDVEDLNQLALALRLQSIDMYFDLTADGQIDIQDQIYWIHDLADTYVGDANLDGEFNSGDLVRAFQAGYEDAISENSGWATGDWNADGEFTSSDLVVAIADGGYEQGPRAAMSTVSEPASFVLLIVCLIGISTCRATRRSVRPHAQ